MNEPHEAPPPKPPPPPPPPTTGETTAHLEVPFEDTYLVGLPPGTVPSRAGCEAKINPWCEQSCTRTKLDQKRSLSAFHTALQSYSNDYHEALLSLANPIDYNPRHPAQIPIATQFKRSLSHARYSGRQSARRLPSPQLLLPPAQSSDAILIGQAHSGPSLFQPPTFTTLPIIQYYQDDMTDQKQQHSSAQRNNDTSQSIPSIMNPPITHQPRFAGAPNFIRFNNGTPQPQLLDGYSPPCLLPQMPLSAPHLARHTLPNIIRPPSVMRPVINLQQAHSSGRPNVSQHPAHSGDLTSRAQPVRPPLEDFMRYISNTVPGLSFDQLLQLFQQSSNPNSIRLNVPPNVDLTTLQNNLEQARHLIMGMHNSTPLQYQHQQQPRPQPPPTNHPPTTPIAAAAINNLTLNNARPPLPTEDDMVLQDLHADADNDEEYHEIETYSDYRPVKLKLGKAHPDPVVETSSLSTVEPPDINYHLKLPEKVIEGALLSSLQLESVIYACQQHAQLMPDKKTRRGFLIGDGAGVGKGRTIAGIIYENYLNGRKKSIWLSVSSDLKLDAERDLKDIGAKVPVFLLNKFQYGRRINEDHGVIFTTYSGLVSKSQSVKGNYGSRLGQLVSWAGNNFDGVIVFDECHKAKNISMGNKKSQKISKAAEYVLEIQEKLPNARIVYASATGASETRHLGYMARLGIWGPGTPYVNFPYFCECIEKRGVGAMELVAVELKMRGSYIARQLSFKTTSFSILRATLSDDFIKLYDECVEMWSLALVYFREAENYFSGNKKLVRTLWSSFWAAHQKFFKYLCISAKVPMVVEIARQSLEAGKCVVIGLQSTGEAKTLEALDEGEINEFISTAKATFESLIDNHFPAPVQGKRRRQPSTSTESDFNPYIANTPSNKSSSTNSSSTIDETWGNTDSCKFIIKDGVALPKIVEGPSTTRRSCRVARKQSAKSGASESLSTTNMNSIDRKQNALYELVKAKKAETKSARTLRHKRRLAIRQGDKSRIKKTSLDDTDTEISDPLSGSPEHLLSDSSLTISQSSGSDYEADTVTEFDGSDDELMVVGTKSARAKKVNSKIIEEEEEEDSGDDVRITAVKEIVTIDSDPETSPMDESDSAHEGQVNDPMVTHGTRLTQMQNELYAKIDALGPRLPNNTLDDLIDRLGGPDFVAEMTGRKGRVVKDAYGRIKYKQRNEVDCADNMNIEEKKRFMDGEKFIAIISEAASSGISLQADKRVKNTRRRVHITIELPWSADRAIQQFGRTHRSNQSSGPEYVFIISELAGETRFASIVAKRLESLGALTHGDRRATTDSRDLSQFNMTSKYCRNALELMAKLLDFNHHFADIRPNYKQGDFVKDAREAYVGTGLAHYGYGGNFNTENVALNINVFLNRLLGMKVNIQNAVFDLFVKITDRLITRRKVAGEFDAGILELNSASGKMKVEEPETFLLKTSSTIVRCSLRHVRYERGITWEDAKARLEACQDDDLRNGFYLTTNSTTKARLVILVVRESLDMFRIFKPNVGRQPKLEYFSTVTEKFTKASSNLREAERVWRYIYVSTDTNCVHMCYFNSCKRIEAKMKCDVGIRHRLFYILSGGILTTWPYLERRVPEATRRINIVRLRLDDDTRVIGPSIPLDLVDKVRAVLREGEINGIEFNTKK